MHLTALKKRLGDILVDVGIITKDQLAKALETQKVSGEKLGAILARMGIINEEVMLAFLGKQCGVSYISITEYGEIQPDVIRSIPESVARHQALIPISKENNTLTIAMADPFNVFAVDDIKVMTGFDVNVVIASEGDIKAAIEKYYSAKPDLDATSIENLLKDKKEVSDEELVNAIISEAVHNRSSDIHIEPSAEAFRLRFRVDGILQESPALPKKHYKAILAKIKKMAGIDSRISDMNLPVEGKIKVSAFNTEIDLRVSIMPTVTGQKITLQVLNTETLCRDLSKLGFETETLATYKKNIDAHAGLIIITSPINSGKTTTLYSTISTLNHPDLNVVTIEDPVRYVIPGTTQIQVASEAGLTFAAAIKSSLSQNPDILMIDEVHDPETAKLCINAALTGRFVFASFSIPDSVGAISHLINMGIEPFMISSALKMVLAQRLMRIICPNCKEKYTIATKNLINIGIPLALIGKEGDIDLWRGKGCAQCNSTGYKGLLPIFELLELNEKMRALILEKSTESSLRQAAIQNGFITLRDAAWKKVRAGVSTAEEMLRITKYAE